MNISKYIVNPFRMDDDEKPKEEQPSPESKILAKKLEKQFFEKRAVYLWGVVEDKSAKML
jgi:ATP-dependent Clp protease protease subunit